jgi:dinuclear metal center YbgI/SA1388 family protein
VKIKEIQHYLESLAPINYQESYDNSGLIIGNGETEISNVLICLDCTEEIVEEAIQKKCNLIVSHHPIIFSGIKKLNGKNYIERTVIKAIENKIAIYAIHTNFDNYNFGVNFEIANRIGIKNTSVLLPKKNLNKLVVYTPIDSVQTVNKSLFEIGVGEIGNYSKCSFNSEGMGTFQPNENANPTIGTANQLEKVKEIRSEYIVPEHLISKALNTLKNSHPYEEVAYDIIPLKNNNQTIGSGMVGELEEEMNTIDFLKLIKEKFNCGIIRHTTIVKDKIKKVAFCGGSGSFLLPQAKAVNADIFITGDYKYHDFFDAEDEILIADIGHFESEQYTTNLLADILTKKFPTFAFYKTEIITNPINYF